MQAKLKREVRGMLVIAYFAKKVGVNTVFHIAGTATDKELFCCANGAKRIVVLFVRPRLQNTF